MIRRIRTELEFIQLQCDLIHFEELCRLRFSDSISCNLSDGSLTYVTADCRNGFTDYVDNRCNSPWQLSDSASWAAPLHPRYVAAIVREATIRLKRCPNLNQASTALSRQITICGDIHGKLDDLLIVLHKRVLRFRVKEVIKEA
ncbi:hypothetical protein J437_LFUL001497 [Ladona fulva]|uniref:Uncharacterized protein n=1 Tax=Ladona fulva TaxID=123851 RepID=A0A8K0NW23_LADFU|nr:hypothetical protein J437_LFUL001497 [Ladona fulva]